MTYKTIIDPKNRGNIIGDGKKKAKTIVGRKYITLINV